MSNWKKCFWHDMALSVHEFYAPKRFTVSPGLTITKVRIWGLNPSKMSKNPIKRFIISLADVGPLSGPPEAHIT